MAETLHDDSTDTRRRDTNAARILVAYATKYGSTRGVAERIAATLRQGGYRVEVHRAEDVADVTMYDAVVFGSAVFNQVGCPKVSGSSRKISARLPAERCGCSALARSEIASASSVRS